RRITTYIHYFFRSNFHNLFNYVFVQSVTWWISDNYVWLTVLSNKSIVENNFHISNKELTIVNVIAFSIGLSIFNSIRNTFDTNYFFSFFRNKLRNSSCSCV